MKNQIPLDNKVSSIQPLLQQTSYDYHTKLENTDTTEMLCRLLKQQSASEVDTDCFDGNPLNYTYFMTIFREIVESKIEDP